MTRVPVRLVRPQSTLVLILLLAAVHSALYALWLPPWGLIDEAQHVHIIQEAAAGRPLPIVGESYLSDEIIASLFATQRWEVFHWPSPPGPDPAQLGLEGHSYEAYHPPLYYLLMAPVYAVLPASILSKVFGLRLVMVALSLLGVWAAYATARLLWPADVRPALVAALILAVLPERAHALSRINNDGLLAMWAALWLLPLTAALLHGMTPARGRYLGLLLGLGVWTKVSAGLLGIGLLPVVWLRRHDPAWRSSLLVGGGILAIAGASVLARNLTIYGDVTGFGAFRGLHAGPFSAEPLPGVWVTLATVVNHTWVIWWKGSVAGSNLLLTGFYLVMGIVLVVALARLLAVSLLTPSSLNRIWLVYGLLVAVYVTALLAGYYAGMAPVVQGRFLLPALTPLILLMVGGLWRLRGGLWLLVGVALLLLLMSMAALFANLIPYHYFWSGVLAGSVAPPGQATLMELAQITWTRALADKPAGSGLWLLGVTAVTVPVTLASFVMVALRIRTHPVGTVQP